MITMRLSEIAPKLNARLVNGDAEFRFISIDSRSLNPEDCFIAIQGPNFDGHEFVAQAKVQGAVAAIVTREVPVDLPQLIVDNTDDALTQLAILRRTQLKMPIVSVTGSCGKTTTKSMMGSILSHCGFVHAGKKSFNNHYGVPLTILGIDDTHEFAVVEMGANHPGEIAHLTAITKPDVAVLIMAAPVHLEGFISLDGVAEAKGEIFQGLGPNGVAVINQDDRYAEYWKGLVKDKKVVTFGLSKNADVFADSITSDADQHPQFQLHTPQGETQITLPLMGEHNIVNALAAAAATLSMSAGLDAIKAGLEAMTPVDKRLVKKIGHLGVEILDDSYNANPIGVEAALRVLAKNDKEKIFVLGEMAELGEHAKDYHAQLGVQAREYGVEKLYAIGGLTQHTVATFGEGATHFTEQAALIAALKRDVTPGSCVLVKGSFCNRLENVVNALMRVEDKT